MLLHVELRRRLARLELVTLLVRGGYLPLKRGIIGIRRMVFIRPSLHLGGGVQVPPELLQLGSDPRQVAHSLLHRARRSEAVLVDTHGTRRRDSVRGQAQHPCGGERHLRRGFHAHARGTKGLERRCRDATEPTRRVLRVTGDDTRVDTQRLRVILGALHDADVADVVPHLPTRGSRSFTIARHLRRGANLRRFRSAARSVVRLCVHVVDPGAHAVSPQRLHPRLQLLQVPVQHRLLRRLGYVVRVDDEIPALLRRHRPALAHRLVVRRERFVARGFIFFNIRVDRAFHRGRRVACPQGLGLGLRRVHRALAQAVFRLGRQRRVRRLKRKFSVLEVSGHRQPPRFDVIRRVRVSNPRPIRRILDPLPLGELFLTPVCREGCGFTPAHGWVPAPGVSSALLGRFQRSCKENTTSYELPIQILK